MNSRPGLIIPAIIAIVALAAVFALNPTMQDDDPDSGQAHVFPRPVEEEDRDYPLAPVAEKSYDSLWFRGGGSLPHTLNQP